ncbi:RNA polymerase sigma factor [Diaphorobacter sp. HDW4B]|nr:RNA polymerase sigma factor [Diaphorobacter sp. HDW4B]
MDVCWSPPSSVCLCGVPRRVFKERIVVIPAQASVVAEVSEDRETLFRNLVQSHGTRLHRFIVKNIGNRDEAHDMTQQAFLEAVRSFETYKGQSELSTWLYGIAMNLVRNHLSRAPHRRYEFTDESELTHVVSESLSPDEAADQAQHLRHLQAAMAELPESMRDVLLMVAVDEMSYEEAAALLTVPVGTVRSRLSRARAALKDKLLARGVTLDF